MAGLVFEIIADFKMTAGAAVLESRKIKNALDGVSNSAKRAQDAVAGFGLNIASSLGLGSLSFLGVLGKSIAVSEKFNQTINDFAGIISSNLEVFEGGFFDKFNTRVQFSSQLMKDLGREADSIGARERDLFSIFKSIAFAGLQGGLQIKQIKDLARNVTLAAPIAGLDERLVGDQLFRLALSGVAGSPRLFKTLLAETQTFAPFRKQGGPREFGQLDFAKRVQLIAAAFAEFGDKPELIARRLQTLSGAMAVLKNQIDGANGLLKPLGDLFIPVIVRSLNYWTRLMKGPFKHAMNEGVRVLKGFMDTPLEMAKDIRQVAALSTNREMVVSTLKLIPTLLIASFGVNLLSKTMLGNVGIVGKVIRVFNRMGLAFTGFVQSVLTGGAVFSGGLGGMVSGFFGAGILAKIAMGFKVLFEVIARLSIFVFALFLVFQILSRAMDEWRISLLAWLDKMSLRIATTLGRFADALRIIWSPIQNFIEVAAKVVGAGFILQGVLSILLTILEVFSQLFMVLAAGVVGIKGLLASMITFMAGWQEFKQLMFQGKFAQAGETLKMLPQEMGKEFLKQFEDAGLFGMKPGTSPLMNPTVEHHGDIVINNDIKEAFEPDRIAFTITEQIQKALLRPTTAAGNSFMTQSASKVLGR